MPDDRNLALNCKVFGSASYYTGGADIISSDPRVVCGGTDSADNPTDYCQQLFIKQGDDNRCGFVIDLNGPHQITSAYIEARARSVIGGNLGDYPFGLQYTNNGDPDSPAAVWTDIGSTVTFSDYTTWLKPGGAVSAVARFIRVLFIGVPWGSSWHCRVDLRNCQIYGDNTGIELTDTSDTALSTHSTIFKGTSPYYDLGDRPIGSTSSAVTLRVHNNTGKNCTSCLVSFNPDFAYDLKTSRHLIKEIGRDLDAPPMLEISANGSDWTGFSANQLTNWALANEGATFDWYATGSDNGITNGNICQTDLQGNYLAGGATSINFYNPGAVVVEFTLAEEKQIKTLWAGIWASSLQANDIAKDITIEYTTSLSSSKSAARGTDGWTIAKTYNYTSQTYVTQEMIYHTFDTPVAIRKFRLYYVNSFYSSSSPKHIPIRLVGAFEDWAPSVDLGPIANGAYKPFYIRTNIPEGTTEVQRKAMLSVKMKLEV